MTASEPRVAQMAVEEVSAKEIAQELFVTAKTVEVHLSRAYRKLDIASRLLAEAHVQELRRSRQAWHAQPSNTNVRIAARHRNAAGLPSYVARAIERFAGHPAPEA